MSVQVQTEDGGGSGVGVSMESKPIPEKQTVKGAVIDLIAGTAGNFRLKDGQNHDSIMGLQNHTDFSEFHLNSSLNFKAW